MSYELINAGDTITILHRIVDATGTPLTSANVSSVAIAVYDLDADEQTFAATPSVTTVITSLMIDPAWTTDTIGFNFSYTIAGTSFSTADHRYTVTTVITPTSGLASQVVDFVQTRAI